MTHRPIPVYTLFVAICTLALVVSVVGTRAHAQTQPKSAASTAAQSNTAVDATCESWERQRKKTCSDVGSAYAPASAPQLPPKVPPVQPVLPKGCTVDTKSPGQVRCTDYGKGEKGTVIYTFACGTTGAMRGKLRDLDRISPYYTVDIQQSSAASPSTSRQAVLPTRASCMPDSEARELGGTKAKPNAACGKSGSAWGSESKADDPRSCTSGLVRFTGIPYSESLTKKMQQQFTCFTSTTPTRSGTATLAQPASSTVTLCRDDQERFQKLVETETKHLTGGAAASATVGAFTTGEALVTPHTMPTSASAGTAVAPVSSASSCGSSSYDDRCLGSGSVTPDVKPPSNAEDGAARAARFSTAETSVGARDSSSSITGSIHRDNARAELEDYFESQKLIRAENMNTSPPSLGYQRQYFEKAAELNALDRQDAAAHGASKTWFNSEAHYAQRLEGSTNAFEYQQVRAQACAQFRTPQRCTFIPYSSAKW